MTQPKFSIFMIVQNEAHHLRKALDSAKFADEIIIVDGGSQDNTLEIAREYTQQVFSHPYKGCGPQKAKALSLTSGAWVMNLDADEVISAALQAEIQAVIQSPNDYSGFEIPFQSYYCQKPIQYGDWFREKHLRLFKKKCGKIDARLIHFGLAVEGKIGRLQHKIHHYSFADFEKVLEKINTYSTWGAKEKFKTGQRGGILKACIRGLWTFIRGYILRFGFLDGREGFLLAVSNAEGCYYRYVKLDYFYQNQQKELKHARTL